jgi:hypothetical protein
MHLLYPVYPSSYTPPYFSCSLQEEAAYSHKEEITSLQHFVKSSSSNNMSSNSSSSSSSSTIGSSSSSSFDSSSSSSSSSSNSSTSMAKSYGGFSVNASVSYTTTARPPPPAAPAEDKKYVRKGADTVWIDDVRLMISRLCTSPMYDPSPHLCMILTYDASTQSSSLYTLYTPYIHPLYTQTLKEWPDNDYRIFVGDIAKEVNTEHLQRQFQHYKSFAKAKVCRTKHENKGIV